MIIMGSARRGGAGYLLDSLPAPWGAWSMRLLRSDYSGPCLRLRNGTTDAESDFGFAAPVNGQRWVDADAMIAWLGGAEGYVRTWYGQGGAGRDAVNTVPTNQPRIVAAGGVLDAKNGHPAMTKSDTIARLTTAAYAHGASSFETFAAASIDSGNYARVVSIRGSTDGQDYSTSTSVAAILRDNANAAFVAYRQNPLASRAITIGTMAAMHNRFGAGDSVVNGANGAESSSTYSTAALAANVTVSLMCDAAQTGQMTGHLGEAIHWSVALDAAKRAAIYADIQSAWGI